MYIDSHTHFDICLEYNNITEKELIAGLKDKNVTYSVQVATETSGFEWAYDFASKFDGVLFSIGIHPSSRAEANDLEYLSEFIREVTESNKRSKLFGIGETGLDYYRMRQPKETQLYSFEYQIDLAKRFDLPLIVHSRDALDETLSILKKKLPKTGIMHCFSGNIETAKQFLDIGFYLSFAGNVTYKKALMLQEVASYVPLDKMLLETDAPFLTPVPLRGKKNRPEYVLHTYEFLANLRNMNLFTLQNIIYDNFTNLAGL